MMVRKVQEIRRVFRSKEEAKTSYNRMSSIYELFGRFEQKFRERGLQLLNVVQGEQVLEIGFGTGYALLKLAQSVGESGKVHGVDLSEKMCNISQTRLIRAGLFGRVHLQVDDAIHLPFNNNFFDGIFMSFTLELFDTPEISIVLSECKRVLRPEGRISIVALSKTGKQSVITRLYEWIHDYFPNIADCRPIYVRDALVKAMFLIIKQQLMPMWGLSVEIVLAEKKSS